MNIYTKIKRKTNEKSAKKQFFSDNGVSNCTKQCVLRL